MKGSKAFYLLAVVSAVLIIGVAYAAITNVTLDVDGYAKAAPSDANFKVAYTGENTIINITDASGAAKTGLDNKVTATATDGTTSATLNINEGVLVSKGDKVTATFEVDNASVDLLATLATSTSTTGVDSDYFDVEVELGSTTIEPSKTTTVTVSVELIRTPTEPVQTDVDVAVVASASEYTAQ